MCIKRTESSALCALILSGCLQRARAQEGRSAEDVRGSGGDRTPGSFLC